MVAKLEYFLIAQSVAFDQQTNRVSVFNILEDFAGSVQVQEMVAVASFLFDALEPESLVDVQLCVEPPEASREIVSDFRVTVRNPRHRLCIRLDGYDFSGEGEYRFEISAHGEHMASHVIRVLPPEKTQ